MTAAPAATDRAPRAIPAWWSAPPSRNPAAALRRATADPGRVAALLGETAPDPVERRWTRVHMDAALELWLITWPAGSRTGWHDHGRSAGAFTVLQGELVELTWARTLHLRPLGSGDVRGFGSDHIHDVRNVSGAPGVSLHAYAPRLEVMRRYRLGGDGLELLGVEREGEW